MKIVNNIISKKILDLKKNGLFSFKRSLEDEGASLEIIKINKKIANIFNLKLSIKIGGCEAIRDLINVKKIKSNYVTAPMIESDFALNKYINSSKNILSNKVKKFFNIETLHAYKNLKKILNVKNFSQISGVIVGRNDLENSLISSKRKYTIENLTHKILKLCKQKKNIITGIGGKLSSGDIFFIKKMYNLNILDFIETRNIMIKLNKKNIYNLKNIINKSLLLENLLNKKLNSITKEKNYNYYQRYKSILKRINYK